MSHLITIIASLLVFAGHAPNPPARAPQGALDLRKVPAAAKWVAHFDVAAFLRSGLGAMVLEEMARPDREAGLTVLRNLSGIDLRQDIRSITIFGIGAGEDQGVALIAGRFEQDKIMALLRTNPTLREHELGARRLYEWTDDPRAENPGPQRFGLFYRDDLIVAGGDRQLLEQSVAVLDGEAAAIDAEAQDWQSMPEAYLGLYLSELPQPPADDRAALLLEKIKSGRIEIGEREGQQFVHASLDTTDARMATNLQRMGEGFLALLDMARDIREEGRPALPPVAETILADMKLSTRDTMVQLSMSTPVENVVAAMAWMAEQREHREGE